MPSDLDFISRPNPVEPSALNSGNLSAHHLDRTTNEQLMPFLLNSRHVQPRRDASFDVAKQARQVDQTSGLPITNVLNIDESTQITPPRQDQALYTLPRPPVKPNTSTKRHRVPPVLQGLLEPPRTSRILPSISAEDALLPSTRNSRAILNETPFPEKESQTISFVDPSSSESRLVDLKASNKRTVYRNKWTDQETNDLLRGVAKFGIGSWKKILMCSEFTFNKRTAVDLKDRFRVCKPNAYGNPRTKKAKQALQEKAVKSAKTVTSSKQLYRSDGNDRSSTVFTAIADQNIDCDDDSGLESDSAMWKVKRRKRRRFTAEEDEALLLGYEEHGASWQSIQKNEIFQSTGRTPTDLRDRFRTRFPEQYEKAGLVPRPTNFPKPLPRGGASADDQPETAAPTENTVAGPEPSKVSPSGPSWYAPALSRVGYHPHGLPPPRIPDGFLPEFAGFDDDDDDASHIVLDRSIVDWANSNMPFNRPVPHADIGILPGIDPLITLKLPKPGAF